MPRNKRPVHYLNRTAVNKRARIARIAKIAALRSQLRMETDAEMKEALQARIDTLEKEPD